MPRGIAEGHLRDSSALQVEAHVVLVGHADAAVHLDRLAADEARGVAGVCFRGRARQRRVGVAVLQTAILMAFFLPFSYVMDRMMYRTYLRRTGAAPPDRKRKT